MCACACVRACVREQTCQSVLWALYPQQRWGLHLAVINWHLFQSRQTVRPFSSPISPPPALARLLPHSTPVPPPALHTTCPALLFSLTEPSLPRDAQAQGMYACAAADCALCLLSSCLRPPSTRCPCTLLPSPNSFHHVYALHPRPYTMRRGGGASYEMPAHARLWQLNGSILCCVCRVIVHCVCCVPCVCCVC